jgi:PKHD-type hydroxylase
MNEHKIAESLVHYPMAIPDDLIDLMTNEVQKINQDLFCESKVGKLEDSMSVKDIRNSKVSWWYEEHWVTSIFSHYFNIANKNNWEYDLTYLKAIQVTKYENNGRYDWHCDYGTEPDSNHTRKLSATLLISDPDEFEGGDLEFIDYHGRVNVAPRLRGTMTVFDSRLPHRVSPLISGTRISLVCWMLGPKLR